jgi:hypothetical protein
MTDGNPLIIACAIDEMNSLLNQRPMLGDRISYIHNISEIQDLYYRLLKNLSHEERDLLSALISRPKPVSRIQLLLLDQYYSKNLSLNASKSLISKGILYKEAGLFKLSNVSKKYFASVFNIPLK